MKARWLFTAGTVAFLVTTCTSLPATLITERLPTQQVQINAVSGSVFNGKAASAVLPNGMMFNDIAWRFAPSTLLGLKAGARVSFNYIGAQVESTVAQSLGGVTSLRDSQINADATLIDQLVGLPMLRFTGELSADLDTLDLVNRLPQNIEGLIRWDQATIQGQVPVSLGNVAINWQPNAEQSTGTISNTGGDLALSGSVIVEHNGVYKADLIIQPQAGVSPMVTSTLDVIATKRSGGDYVLSESGNLATMR